MKKVKRITYIAIEILAILIALCSILSVFNNTDNRFLKMLDFMRIQFFIASVVSLILFWVITQKWNTFDYVMVGALCAGLIVNSTYLINYTPLVSKVVPEANFNAENSNNQLSILLTNVKMSNRQSQPIIELLKSKSPDLIIAMEINEWWSEQLKPIYDQYPYSEKSINEVAYGMVLFSKLPLKDLEINFLNNEKVPSIETTVILESGTEIILHAVHPVPPTHYEHLPDNKGQKESELLIIGKKVEEQKRPIILAGDFNDVSWGNSDKLTETENILHDVRVGRWFYNSFDASNIFMRWPLDHVLVTDDFSLVEMERMQDVGSDHFPIYVELSIE